MSNKLWLAICLTIPLVIVIAGGSMANVNQLSTTVQTVYLPDLPIDCMQVFSMTNTTTGVSVCYLAKNGKVRMIEYVPSGDGKHRMFLFRFESDKE